MNKKGFTLVELLAVIIILSLLALLASTSITKIVKDSKSDLYDTQINLIKSAAEAWGADNLYDLPESGTCKYLKLNDLKRYGLIDSEIKNPKTNELFSDELIIKISSEKNTFGLDKVTYEVDPSNIEGCEIVYPVCTLVDDSDNSNSITVGDKYQCRVKNNMEEGFEEGYYFFVLSHNDDGTTNLIMERNMYYDETNKVGKVATEQNIGIVQWHANPGNHDNGPVNAMIYLHNVTKDWDNVPDMIMNYIDENIKSSTQKKGTTGYGGIQTTGNETIITDKNGDPKVRIENLKTRLPRYDEVYGTGKCLGTGHGSCPIWLFNYLSPRTQLEIQAPQNIKGIYGYWTLSSSADSNIYAWLVYYCSSLLAYQVDYYGSVGFGVRPVITLKL